MPWWITVAAALSLLRATLSRSNTSRQLSDSRSEPFEPPKYIASLIAAINDGAKTAQTGALAFSAVGLYLLATALSTTDEDLLLQHTTSIAQLGVQVPVVFSFAIAPLVFVALHAFTLIRYDMLSTNIRQFRADLETLVPLHSDRERCCQLLTNVEFVISRAAPYESPLQSRIFRVIAFGLIAIFPVAVLTVLEVSALRYQSEGVNWAQRGAFVIDIAILVWFFRRQRLAAARKPRFGIHWFLLWLRLLSVPAALVAANLAWLNVPSLDENTVVIPLVWLDVVEPPIVLELDDRWKAFFQKIHLGEFFLQPLDFLCRSPFRWGCRFLTVDHRTLVGHVWKEEAVATLRAGKGGTEAALAGIEGVFLRGRTLRFANLAQSQLYRADLMRADLSKALLISSGLISANLSEAHLIGTDLRGADLHDATMFATDLLCAHLLSANLRDAKMINAVLFNADLRGADLRGAKMAYAISACRGRPGAGGMSGDQANLRQRSDLPAWRTPNPSFATSK